MERNVTLGIAARMARRVVYVSTLRLAEVKEGRAVPASLFGAEMAGRTGLVRKACADKLAEALREARRALHAAEHDDGRAMFDESCSLAVQIDEALAGYEETVKDDG